MIKCAAWAAETVCESLKWENNVSSFFLQREENKLNVRSVFNYSCRWKIKVFLELGSSFRLANSNKKLQYQ